MQKIYLAKPGGQKEGPYTLEQIKEEMDRSASGRRRILMVEDDEAVASFYEIALPERFPERVGEDGECAGVGQYLPIRRRQVS